MDSCRVFIWRSTNRCTLEVHKFLPGFAHFLHFPSTKAMRKASPFLLSNLTNPKLIARRLSHLAAGNPTLTSPLPLNPSNGRTPKPIKFPKYPSTRAAQTLASIPFPPPPDSAPESHSDPGKDPEFETSNLGLSCLKLAQRLDSTGSEDLEKALNLALRALNIFRGGDNGATLLVAKALRLMGSLSCKMGRFDDSLDALTTAEQILARLELECIEHSEIKAIGAEVQDQLATTKTAMGRRKDALLNLRRSLALKRSVLVPNCRELGNAYKSLAEACVFVLEFEEALPFCLKALEIYKSQMGNDSIEVASIRRLLGVAYTGLEKNDEALVQNELARMTLKSSGSDDELIHAEIEAANIQIAMGRFDEGINTVKGVIHRTAKETEARAFALISMAKALCGQEKFGDAKRCLEISCGVLDKIESVSLVKIAEGYAEISMLYEMMNEFETSLLLLKRTLAILAKLPQEQHMAGSISARIGWLLLFTGRVPEAVPQLESAVEKLKDGFGPKNFGVGFVYKHLGQAYLSMDQPQSAVQYLGLAKDIIQSLFGPHHEDSIDTYQSLANAYGAMGRYALAMEFQQQVVDAWESHGPDFRDEFREAHRLLDQIRRKAQGSKSAVFPANTLPLPPQK